MTTSSLISLRGQVAAFSRWSRVTDRTAATAPARRAFLQKFDDEVDPQRLLTPTVRAKRAECARRAYFARLLLKSVATRRRNKDRKAGGDDDAQG